MITARADHGGGPRHLELLIGDASEMIIAHVACPEDEPYWERFSSATSGRVFSIPHRKFDFRRALALASYARLNRIQIVHAHGKGAGLYARLVSAVTGLPSIHTAHGVHIGEYGLFAKTAYRFYENFSARWVNHLIHVSHEEKALAQRAGVWKNLPHTVIPNGVVSHSTAEAEELRCRARKILGIASTKTTVITISRFDHQKNMLEAYDIAKALPSMQFVWIGSGADSAELESKAALEGVENIRMLGQVDEPLSYLAAADIYLSTSRWEGLPLSVLEAMSLGIPSVLSSVTGHVELAETHGAGLLYPLGDIDSATAALHRIASEGPLYSILSEKALQSQTQNFSSQTVAMRTAEIYKEVLDS